jgi:eukaryotic-like serine/threonine-protein kinase
MQPIPYVPGYDLFQRLGGGPMTVVYSARESATDSPCAVKLLREEIEDPVTAIKLLQREARAGLAVRHPHLARLRYAHVTRPPYFLVMDLLPGESLRPRLRRDYRLAVSDAVWIGRQVAEALAALHRAGFLHGDVKPDNVRLVDDGTAVLIDLGFAHRPGENAAFFSRGFVMGTANYLAPELCGPEPEEDFATDLFALGVTLFEMLAGRLPYPLGSVGQTLRRHRCDPPADLRRHVGRLPSALANLIERLMARRPADRPRAGTVLRQLIELEIAVLSRRRSA